MRQRDRETGGQGNRAAARYATLTACQKATTGRKKEKREGGWEEGGDGRWDRDKGEGRGEGRGWGVFDLKNQELGFAPDRNKICSN